MRIKINIGDILKVELPDGRHTYAQISTSPLVIFYEYAAHEEVELTSVPQLPIAFKIFVDQDVLRSGDWPKLGNVSMTKDELRIPYMYKQDIINGKLSIYHTDFEKTNFERSANLSEVETLATATVPGNFSDTVAAAESFAQSVNDAGVNYDAFYTNSNSTAGTGFEQLTGQSRPSDANYPALGTDLCNGRVEC